MYALSLANSVTGSPCTHLPTFSLGAGSPMPGGVRSQGSRGPGKHGLRKQGGSEGGGEESFLRCGHGDFKVPAWVFFVNWPDVWES